MCLRWRRPFATAPPPRVWFYYLNDRGCLYAQAPGCGAGGATKAVGSPLMQSHTHSPPHPCLSTICVVICHIISVLTRHVLSSTLHSSIYFGVFFFVTISAGRQVDDPPVFRVRVIVGFSIRTRDTVSVEPFAHQSFLP